MQFTKQKFENLDIWKLSIEIAEQICHIAEILEKLQMYKVSEYLKDICMRTSNHIAEISESCVEQNVNRSLMKAHLLTLEAENIIMILYEQQLVDTPTKESLLKKIQILDYKILEYNQHFGNRHMLIFNDE
jgi:hypothetical protein